jgi:predicted Holliday junction resolvase-like endonuclease
MTTTLVLILMLQVAGLVLEIVLYRRVRDMLIEAGQLLTIIKEWANSARTRHNDAHEVMAATKEVTEQIPAKVEAAIEAAVKKSGSGESGVLVTPGK